MTQHFDIIARPGEHVLIVGQNGSGKTAFACWYLLRIPQTPIIIYDTKEEPKFAKLPASIIVPNIEEGLKLINDAQYDYIVIRPPVEYMLRPDLLDLMLWEHYNKAKGIAAYIDEAYTFHTNGKAGPGLTALLTRGRSRGISTIISTQRPVLLSRFCVTEAKKVFVFRLTDKADKRRLDDVIPNFSDENNPPKHGFYYFEAQLDTPQLFKPIKLDPVFDTGYFDVGAENTGEASNHASQVDGITPIKLVWV